MHKQINKLIAAFGVLALTAGCAATPAKDYLLTDSVPASGLGFSDLVDRVRESAEKAQGRADFDTRTTEIVGLGLIGVGLAAVGGIFFDAHNDYLAGAGLAAAGLGSVNQFYNPTNSHDAHITASQKLRCLADASDPLRDSTPLLGLINLQQNPFSAQMAMIENTKTYLLHTAFSEVVAELQKSTRPTPLEIDSIVESAINARAKYIAKRTDVNNVAGLLADQRSLLLVGYPENLTSCVATGKPAGPA